MKKAEVLSLLKVLTIALVLTTGVNYIFAAWTEPTENPPQGNVPAPINTGYEGQTKLGNVIIQGLNQANEALANGLIVLNGNVGIGTANPTAKLEVAGQVKISGGSPGAGKVLTSDANGVATWTTPASGGGPSATDVAFFPRSTADKTVRIDMNGFSVASGEFGGWDYSGTWSDYQGVRFTFNKAAKKLTYAVNSAVAPAPTNPCFSSTAGSHTMSSYRNSDAEETDDEWWGVVGACNAAGTPLQAVWYFTYDTTTQILRVQEHQPSGTGSNMNGSILVNKW